MKKSTKITFRIEAEKKEYAVSKRAEALSIIADLQTNHVSPIVFFNDEEKSAVIYSKSSHEQNYRINPAEYVAPQIVEKLEVV
ncbi:hypothetical protein [Flavobacterium columnare]|uniref:Uncharacterized protein n=1 Tax=Flavobacterium columnare (strain ATCC 49512 / CIP 103533 / TG 44/87) TaxID=1041826 RepID=G8X9H1_FLACA|nr:hypothetical protein [Flavobacterium columnare]AEW85918.1 hypothetical protein FCOL_05465 [Flavobacterium columnare ATCC 49512]